MYAYLNQFGVFMFSNLLVLSPTQAKRFTLISMFDDLVFKYFSLFQVVYDLF